MILSLLKKTIVYRFFNIQKVSKNTGLISIILKLSLVQGTLKKYYMILGLMSMKIPLCALLNKMTNDALKVKKVWSSTRSMN